MIEVRRYNRTEADVWNAFVEGSKADSSDAKTVPISTPIWNDFAKHSSISITIPAANAMSMFSTFGLCAIAATSTTSAVGMIMNGSTNISTPIRTLPTIVYAIPP